MCRLGGGGSRGGACRPASRRGPRRAQRGGGSGCRAFFRWPGRRPRSDHREQPRGADPALITLVAAQREGGGLLEAEDGLGCASSVGASGARWSSRRGQGRQPLQRRPGAVGRFVEDKARARLPNQSASRADAPDPCGVLERNDGWAEQPVVGRQAWLVALAPTATWSGQLEGASEGASRRGADAWPSLLIPARPLRASGATPRRRTCGLLPPRRLAQRRRQAARRDVRASISLTTSRRRRRALPLRPPGLSLPTLDE